MAAIFNKALWFFMVISMFSITTDAKKKKEKKHKIKSYFMSNFCGQTINMTDRNMEEMMLELTSHGHYESFMDCEMTIETSQNKTLSLSFIDLKMADCGDSVIIYGNSTNSSDAITTHLCSKPSDIYTTDGPQAIVKFHSNLFGSAGGFQLLITSFYIPDDDICRSDYFQCRNGRCIKRGLFCNTRDNCGDESDNYENCDDDGIWWKVMLGVSGAIPFFFGVAFCCFLKFQQNKRSRMKCGIVHATAQQRWVFQNQPQASGLSGTTSTATTNTQATGHSNPMSPPPPYSTELQNTSSGKSATQYWDPMSNAYTAPSAPGLLDGEVPGPAVYFNPPQPDLRT